MSQTMTGSRRTEKQLKYYKARTELKTQIAAAKEAGYNPNGGTIQSLERSMKALMQDELKAQGITPELLAQKVREGLEATGVRAFKTKDDAIIHEEYADYETRRLYVELAARLIGVDPKQADTPEASQSINVLQVIQKFSHLSDDEFAEAMQRHRNGLLEQKAIPVNGHLAVDCLAPPEPPSVSRL